MVWQMLRQPLKQADLHAAFHPVCHIFVLVHPIPGSAGTIPEVQMRSGHHGDERDTPVLLSKKNSNSPIHLEM